MIKGKNDRDRELFSEFIEPSIHPNLIQVVPPFLEESNPVFIIQMSGEAAWKWRVFYWLPRRVFNSLQASILPLGYMHYIQNLMILPRSGWSHSRRKYKGI